MVWEETGGPPVAEPDVARLRHAKRHRQHRVAARRKGRIRLAPRRPAMPPVGAAVAARQSRTTEARLREARVERRRGALGAVGRSADPAPNSRYGRPRRQAAGRLARAASIARDQFVRAKRLLQADDVGQVRAFSTRSRAPSCRISPRSADRARVRASSTIRSDAVAALQENIDDREIETGFLERLQSGGGAGGFDDFEMVDPQHDCDHRPNIGLVVDRQERGA